MQPNGCSSMLQVQGIILLLQCIALVHEILTLLRMLLVNGQCKCVAYRMCMCARACARVSAHSITCLHHLYYPIYNYCYCATGSQCIFLVFIGLFGWHCA